MKISSLKKNMIFEKKYDLKIPDINLTGAALVEYCKQNDILILVGVNDSSSGLGVSFLYCYE